MKKLLLILFVAGLAGTALSCGSDNNAEVEPVISELTSEYDGKAMIDKPVTIVGSNFSKKISDNEVLLGVGLESVKAEIKEAAEDHIVFIAPDVKRDYIKVRVSVRGVESTSVLMEYIKEAPIDEPWDDTPTITLEGAVTKTVCPGVEWTTFHGRWEGEVRNINIIKTTLNEHNTIGVFFDYSHNGLDDLDQKCEHVGAIAGTNGPMKCCQFMRIDGVIKNPPTDQSAEPWTVNCAFTIDNNVIDIVKVKDNYDAAKLTNNTVGCAGPLLVFNGKIQSYSEETSVDFLKTTHPRTAIGISKDGKTVYQVAIDGRWDRSSNDERAIGMPTPLLSKFMRGLGCYKAMNLDGGGGTAMWVKGYGNSRNIVNRVSENRWDWNGTTLRATGNAVYIKTDQK